MEWKYNKDVKGEEENIYKKSFLLKYFLHDFPLK
jgi:hypothetical protein